MWHGHHDHYIVTSRVSIEAAHSDLAPASHTMRPSWCVVALLLCGALAAPARAQSADELPDIAAGVDEAVGAVSEESPAATAAAAARSFFELRAQSSWVPELCALAFMGAFLINMYVGRARNERLALAWTSEVWCSAVQCGGGAGVHATGWAAAAACSLSATLL